MNIHNICFHVEIRKIISFHSLIWDYVFTGTYTARIGYMQGFQGPRFTLLYVLLLLLLLLLLMTQRAPPSDRKDPDQPAEIYSLIRTFAILLYVL